MWWQVVWSSVVGSAFGTLSSLLLAWVSAHLRRSSEIQRCAAEHARELYSAVVDGEMRPETAQTAIRLLRVSTRRLTPGFRRYAEQVNAPLDAWLDALDDLRFPLERAEDYPEYEDGEQEGPP